MQPPPDSATVTGAVHGQQVANSEPQHRCRADIMDSASRSSQAHVHELSSAVVEAVRLHFSPAAQPDVLERLTRLHADSTEAHERLALAIVRLSGGDVATVRGYANRAVLDAEMVVHRADHPEELGGRRSQP